MNDRQRLVLAVLTVGATNEPELRRRLGLPEMTAAEFVQNVERNLRGLKRWGAALAEEKSS